MSPDPAAGLSGHRRDWRPQRPTVSMRPPVVRDPIVEPHWSGRRVLFHFRAAAPSQPGLALLLDEEGQQVDEGDEALREALRHAVLAAEAVIDGCLTTQASRSGIGASQLTATGGTAMGFLLGRTGSIEVDVVRRDNERDPDQAALAFVAIDLLSVDDQELLDLPLLERKRLLEGTIAAGEQVRISPFTKPPVEQWLASWKGVGFEGAVLKAANSRYRPTTVSAEWVLVTRLGR